MPTSSASSSRTARRTAWSSQSGERIAADIVVSNADSAWTYRHLVPPEPRRRWTDAKLDRAQLFDGPVCLVFRRRPPLRRHRPSHDPDGPALPRAAEGHFRAQSARRGFQPLSASPDRDRSRARAAGLRCVLRALAGAQPAGRPGLARRGGALSPTHRRLAGGEPAAGPLANISSSRKSRRRSISATGSTRRTARVSGSSRC